MPNSPIIYRLKILLTGSSPPIWRRLEVTGSTRLDLLSDIIQAVFDWEGDHLHAFEVGRVSYGPADMQDPWDFNPAKDESLCTLAKIARVGASFDYIYDFGDNWTHRVTVEATGPPLPGVSYPRCVTGQRAAPPEDCGGLWSYSDLCAALANPEQVEDDDQAAWIDAIQDDDFAEAFDPERFSADEVNSRLANISRSLPCLLGAGGGTGGRG
jgi:hypothetical protein